MPTVFDEFLGAHPGWKAPTRERYRYCLKLFARYLDQQELSWTQVTARHLADYEQQRLWTQNGRGGLWSAQSLHQALRVLRLFYRWAQQQGRLAQSPQAGRILPKPPRPAAPLPDSNQTLQILNQPDLGQAVGHRDLLILELFYAGWTAHRCRLLHLPQAHELPVCVQHNGRLERYLADGRPWLFPAPDCQTLILTAYGKPFRTDQGLCLRLALCCRQLGCKPLSPRLLHRARRLHEQQLDRHLAAPTPSGEIP